LIEKRRWAFDHYESLSWVAMVEIIGEQDWWGALKLTDRIADSFDRALSLAHLAQTLAGGDALTDVASAQRPLLGAADQMNPTRSTARARSLTPRDPSVSMRL
jgi:hypothetical protein